MPLHPATALFRWSTQHPTVLRVLVLVLAVAAMTLAATMPAHAAGPGDPNDQLDDVTDSRGIPSEKYVVLPFDRGGVDNASKLISGWYISQGWDVTIFVLKQCIWLFQWTLSFEWIDLITAPAQLLADGIQAAVGGLNIIPLALLVTSIVCGLAIVRGKYASGFIGIGISILFAIAATGVLANPVDALVGEKGMIHTAADWGGEIAVRVTNDGVGPTPSDDISDMIDASLSQQLVDIFLRTPAQLISFGKVLEGDCVAVFDNAMKAAPTGDSGSNSVRDAVSQCDPAVAEFIKYPNGQIITLVMVALAMSFLFALALALVLIMFTTVIFAVYRAISLIWKGLLAVFPTADRSGVWHAVFDMLSALAIVTGSIVFLAAYLRFIIMYMTATAGLGLNQFVLVDVLFIGGIVLLFRLRKGLKQQGKKIADRLAKIGGGGAPQSAAPVNPVAAAASIGRTISDLKTLGSRIPTRKPSAAQTLAAPAEPVATPHLGDMTATARRSSAPVPVPGDRPGASQRVREIATAGARTALQAAAFVPTPATASARIAQATLAVADKTRYALPPSSSATSSPNMRIVGSDVGPQTPAITARSERNKRLRSEISDARTTPDPVDPQR